MHPKLAKTFAKYETIVLVGGGTGGHIQPIITLAGELSEKYLLWIGGKDANEEFEAKKYAIPFEHIITLKLSTTHSPSVLAYPFYLLRGIIEARKILKKRKMHSCIFSKGGPGSLAIGIAAWMLDIPLYIHESDTIPGFSNRILGKIATKIFLGFESAEEYFIPEKCEVIGQILHRVFSIESKDELLQNPSITWKTTKPHILVICGSQGAKAIFEGIVKQFQRNDAYEWIISLGKLNVNFKPIFDDMKDIQSFEWIEQEDIANLLKNTDIAVGRGSATTLAEIDAFGVRKIIIPLPESAKNHQYWNAKEYEKMGDVLLEQNNLIQLKTELEILCQNSPRSNT